MRSASTLLRQLWTLAPSWVAGMVAVQVWVGLIMGVLLIAAGVGGNRWVILGVSAIILPTCWSAIWLIAKAEPVSDDPLPKTVHHTTRRLVIRRLERDDVITGNAVMDDSAAAANGWTSEMRGATNALLGAFSSVGRRCHLIVCEIDSGECVAGAVITNHRPPGQWNLGFWVLPVYRGKGFAKEAMAGVLAVIHDAGIPVVHIGTSVENAAMQAVIGSTGSVIVETIPHELPDGTVTESHWYVHTE